MLTLVLLIATFGLRATAQNDVVAPDSCTIEKRHWYIKTNGIGWLMGMANVSFEFEVAKHLSFTVPMYWSSWNYPKHTTKLRTLAYQPELRYWLNHDGGFFGGVHMGVAWWNLATGGKYRRQDRHGTRPAYGGGVSVGWRSIPVNSRFRFECSLGVGYYHFDYDRFLNKPGGEKVDSRTRNLFIIDNASLSLVYTFRMNDKIR
jgi:hypothetical protein